MERALERNLNSVSERPRRRELFRFHYPKSLGQCEKVLTGLLEDLLMKRFALVLLFVLEAAFCLAADLTGNWVAENPLPDGTLRKTYFQLKQEDSRITGHIRVTQFYYTITESTGTPDAFTVTGTLQDGNTPRHVIYEGKLVGDELHMATRRRPDAPLTELVAHRTAQTTARCRRALSHPHCIKFHTTDWQKLRPWAGTAGIVCGSRG